MKRGSKKLHIGILSTTMLFFLLQGIVLGQVIPPPPPPPPPPQDFGTIAGNVTDAATGDSLPGVNIQVLGTTLGSTTDLSGHYLIPNVPPGTYDVRASLTGFKDSIKTDVNVIPNTLAYTNFSLELIVPDIYLCVEKCTITQAQTQAAGAPPILVIGLRVCNEKSDTLKDVTLEIRPDVKEDDEWVEIGEIRVCGDDLNDPSIRFTSQNTTNFARYGDINPNSCGQSLYPITCGYKEFIFDVHNLSVTITELCLHFKVHYYADSRGVLNLTTCGFKNASIQCTNSYWLCKHIVISNLQQQSCTRTAIIGYILGFGTAVIGKLLYDKFK